ncbi:MAG: hypothetical protein ACOYBY_16825 [Dermatophilaceae bacterium]
MGDGRVIRGAVTAAELAAALEDLDLPRRGPALVLTALAPPVPVSVAVIDLVVDELARRGHDVALAGALRLADHDRGVSSVAAMATHAGLGGRTARGTAYQVLDLLAPGEGQALDVPAHSILSGVPVSSRWTDAGLRVVLARAATDLSDGYAGCLDALGLLAPIAGAATAEVAADVARYAPPHLAMADAVEASGGPDGRGVPSPVPTGTLIVGRDPALVDQALARLMGEDRSAARPFAELLRLRGEPPGTLAGDLTPWADFPRADAGLREARRTLDVLPHAARLFDAVAVAPDSLPGSAGDPLLRGLREVYAAWARAGGQPAARAGMGIGLGLAGTLVTAAAAWLTTLDKDHVPTVVTSLGFEPAELPGQEYDGLPDVLAPFERLAAGAPTVAEGLRWTRHDGAVVFRTEREIGARFADFVARVDVAEGISLMADYVGGRRVSVTADEAGRPVRQAERNVYLPQPNAAAAFGGKPIDVCKIELVERAETAHRLRWRTVFSPNGSARSDDGTLSFEDTGRGTVRLVVSGRQEFTLPPALDPRLLARVPGLLDALTTESYRRFFTSTFDNLEACFEGRPFRVGAPPETADSPLLTDLLRFAVEQGLATFGSEAPSRATRRAGREAAEVDLHGFAHFRGNP